LIDFNFVPYYQQDSQPGTDGVMCYEPHSRPVSHIAFNPENSEKLFSSSYDGTVRCMDIAKGVFDEVNIFRKIFISSHTKKYLIAY
jgi:WD40 repeat protein